MRSAKGSVTKIGPNYYRVRVTSKAIDPNTGKPFRLSEYVRGSRKRAEEAKLRLLVEAGEEIVDSPMTYGQFLDTIYLPDKENEVKQGKFKRKTLSNYKAKLRLHVRPTFDNVPLKDMTVFRMKRWLASFDKVTVAKEAYAVTKATLSHAVKNLLLRSNPLMLVDCPEVEQYDPPVLDSQEIEAYLYFFKGETVEAAVLLAIGGGFRRGEICALDVEDIDLGTGAVLVDDAYLTDGGEAYTDTTKNRRKRVVHLPPSITARLSEILPESGPVLTGKDGGRIYPDSVTKAYERVQRRMPSEVKRVPLKNLRHSSLTLAYESGADMMGLQDRGGHSSITTTQRYYLRPKGERDKAIADAMEAKLNPPKVSAKTVTIEVYADSIEAF